VLNLPASVSSIGDFAFGFNINLTNVTIGALIPPQISSSNIFINTGVESGSGNIINVPSTSVSLYESAPGWSNFTFVATPASCFTTAPNQTGLTITDYTCTESVVNIPRQIDGISTTQIGNGAFQDKQLTKVTIPNSITMIGVGAFFQDRLTSVTIPNSVVSIGDSAFSSNELSSVTLSNNLTDIESYVFVLNSLTSVNIPNGVINIRHDAFAFNQLESITLPDSLQNIEVAAFSDNQLTNLTIPSSINTIGDIAFLNNPNLNSVSILAISPPQITSNSIFAATGVAAGSGRSINVPAASVGLYESAPVWLDFNFAPIP
jgi:hypothetical protein